ncbi:hypothetical protein [Aestuariirhabdus sp. LZHN29]|uniref:hypothetical protein n=1 Tax=Aestuariirhabdus sp. LZHN29 TaxID=3417462 RepID=UPI003CF7819D
MKYRLDKSYVDTEKRKSAAMALLGLGFGVYVLFRYGVELDIKAWSGLIFLGYGYIKATDFLYWTYRSDTIAMEMVEQGVWVSTFSETRTLALENIRKVVLYPVHGEIKSVVLHCEDGSTSKVRGFASMDQIVEQLRARLGDDKIITGGFFNR